MAKWRQWATVLVGTAIACVLLVALAKAFSLNAGVVERLAGVVALLEFRHEYSLAAALDLLIVLLCALYIVGTLTAAMVFDWVMRMVREFFMLVRGEEVPEIPPVGHDPVPLRWFGLLLGVYAISVAILRVDALVS